MLSGWFNKIFIESEDLFTLELTKRYCNNLSEEIIKKILVIIVDYDRYDFINFTVLLSSIPKEENIRPFLSGKIIDENLKRRSFVINCIATHEGREIKVSYKGGYIRN
ncbi:MAG: hypothetical protein PHX34_05715 [Candidatus Shapirobacteria bacterium]|nr:hypothetical protein [Candidatus Shapirobacteria bacterium]